MNVLKHARLLALAAAPASVRERRLIYIFCSENTKPRLHTLTFLWKFFIHGELKILQSLYLQKYNY